MSVIPQNIAAFARMLWDSEGTYNAANPAVMYRTLYGGIILPNEPATWKGHPNRSITKWGKTSTAAGAYQFLFRTWVELQTQVKLSSFTPPMQDLGFATRMQMLKTNRSNVYDLVMNGRFEDALPRASKEWTSLPGGVHQRKTLAQVQTVFTSAGGTLI